MKLWPSTHLWCLWSIKFTWSKIYQFSCWQRKCIGLLYRKAKIIFEEIIWKVNILVHVELELYMNYITWWNSSANLLWCRVYVPYKWHFLYKPFSNPEDSWTHPRRHKDSNKKYKHQGGQEPKAWNIVISNCHKKRLWIQERGYLHCTNHNNSPCTQTIQESGYW